MVLQLSQFAQYLNTNVQKLRPQNISELQFGGFHKWWYPKNYGLHGKCHLEMDDLGVQPFQETFWAILIFSW